MEISYNLSSLYPTVKEVEVKVIETNGWPYNRLRCFKYFSNSEVFFHLECPMSKCLGHSSGINLKKVLDDMVSKHEICHREKLTCGGYGGYNLTFHCNWYVILEISVTYQDHRIA